MYEAYQKGEVQSIKAGESMIKAECEAHTCRKFYPPSGTQMLADSQRFVTRTRDLQEAPPASSPKLEPSKHPQIPMKDAEKGGFYRLEHRQIAHHHQMKEILYSPHDGSDEARKWSFFADIDVF